MTIALDRARPLIPRRRHTALKLVLGPLLVLFAALGLALPASAATVSVSPAAAAAPAGLPRGNFQLVNYHTGKCLAEYENDVYVEPCNANDHAQAWRFAGYYGSWYLLVNYHTGKCLTDEPGRILVATCTANHTQLWASHQNSHVYGSEYVDYHTGNCLDVGSFVYAGGRQVVYPNKCDSSHTQVWYFGDIGK